MYVSALEVFIRWLLLCCLSLQSMNYRLHEAAAVLCRIGKWVPPQIRRCWQVILVLLTCELVDLNDPALCTQGHALL